MILTDYFRSAPDRTWEFAKQCGVEYGTIRLPEDEDFDVTNEGHWRTVYDRFMNFGLRPLVVEPMPNSLHDHIKTGDDRRDGCIERVIRMLPIMDALDIRTICFNFMAHIGWLRTANDLKERGGSSVTGFRLADFEPGAESIAEDELWANYAYFIKAVIPHAEKHGIRLALHPDDPPVARLGDVARILISRENIDRAVRGIVQSPSLGVTLCQATYYIMGEDLDEVIADFADRIFFVHFRNVTGNKTDFRETFHDNGDLDMPALIRRYRDCGIDVPIRVDHVPTMAGEESRHSGYDALGRLFAIGYLKGILEATGAE